MKQRFASLVALSLSHLLVSPAHAQANDGLQDIRQLARVNGLALACQEPQIAARAKDLMLRHAPKTARFGTAFDDGTNEAYLAQIRSNAPCPDEATLKFQLTTLALKLQASLPAPAVPNSPTTTP
jgi:hypothetical protein